MSTAAKKSFPVLGNVTKEDLGKLSSAELVQIYNRAAPGAGKKPVKEFNKKSVAVDRVWDLGGEAKEEAKPTKSAGTGGGARGRKREPLNLDATEEQRPTRAGTSVHEILCLFGDGEGATAEAVAAKVKKSVGYVRAVCRGINESHGIGFREDANGVIKVVDRGGRAKIYTAAEPASKKKAAANGTAAPTPPTEA